MSAVPEQDRPPRSAAVKAAVLVAFTMFMAQLDATIIQTAIPDMAKFFNARPIDLGQGITIFVLAQVMLLPAAAWVADRFGVRIVFAAAVAGFTLTSLLCALSHSLDEFLFYRFLQGAAAALMAPVGRLAMVRTAARADLLTMMTIASTPMLIAPTIGPAIGGYLTTFFSWQYIFYINIPIGVVAFALVLRWLPRGVTQRLPFDALGFLMCSAGLTGLIYGLDRASLDGLDWVTLAVLAVGVVGSIAAWRHINRHPAPIISTAPLRDRVFFLMTVGAGGLIRLPSRAMPFIFPLMFQLNFGWSAFTAGLAMFFFSVGDLAIKPLVTPIFRRFGFKSVLIWSVVLLSIATAAAALFSISTPFWLISVVLALAGVFRSIVFSGMSAIIYADIPKSDFNAASLIWSIMQQATNSVGVSLAVLILNASMLAFDSPAGEPAVVDCRIAIVIFAVIGLVSAFSFLKLDANVGARISNKTPPPEEKLSE